MSGRERIARQISFASERTPAVSAPHGPPTLSGQVPAVARKKAVAQRGKAALQRGVAILGFVAALLIIGTLVLWLFHLTATSSQATLGHFFSVGAFYAAESGLEMGLRELKQSPPNDIDSDGLAGTISNNGNPNDDPALATGIFYMERVGTSPPTYRATGRPAELTPPWSTYRRVIEIRLQ